MSSKFVVQHLDQQLGPFDEQELKDKWSKGELLPIDYVYDEAKKDWILLAERFSWVSGTEDGAPPPIKPDAGKKKAPPAPAPIPTASTVEISSQTLLKEWKKPEGHKGAKVKIVNGVGEIDLNSLNPGQVELSLQDSSAATLKLQDPLRIQVRPIEPEEVMWGFALQAPVGQDFEMLIKAVDGKGHVCTHFSGAFVLLIEASESREVNVNLSAGQATVKLHNTKAESWKFSLLNKTERPLRMPEAKSVEWLPGPAARLILDGPPELTAGNPLKVQVKAVDQYGNLAKSFQGTVILDVKAS